MQSVRCDTLTSGGNQRLSSAPYVPRRHRVRGPENTHAYDSTDVRTEFARLHAVSRAASCGHAPPRLARSPLDSPVAANQAVSPTTSEEQRVMPIL